MLIYYINLSGGPIAGCAANEMKVYKLKIGTTGLNIIPLYISYRKKLSFLEYNSNANLGDNTLENGGVLKSLDL